MYKLEAHKKNERAATQTLAHACLRLDILSAVLCSSVCDYNMFNYYIVLN